MNVRHAMMPNISVVSKYILRSPACPWYSLTITGAVTSFAVVECPSQPLLTVFRTHEYLSDNTDVMESRLTIDTFFDGETKIYEVSLLLGCTVDRVSQRA
jgi:hypothetical protein